LNFKLNINRSFILFSFVLIFGSLKASKIENGFKALSIHDYFKAKKIFNSSYKCKKDPYSSYGLATIYSRNNNPFFNLDSAAKYASLSYNLFVIKRAKKEFYSFKIDSIHIFQLIDSIAAKGSERLKKEKSLITCT
jgi:hypothetical protein